MDRLCGQEAPFDASTVGGVIRSVSWIDVREEQPLERAQAAASKPVAANTKEMRWLG